MHTRIVTAVIVFSAAVWMCGQARAQGNLGSISGTVLDATGAVVPGVPIVATDLDRGVMDRFLVTPVSRAAMIAGQLTFQATMTVLQSLIILGLGLLAGARFPGGLASIAAFLLATTLLGSAFAALSNTLALLLRKEESVIAAVNFVVLPLTFLSSTFMPAQLVPQWIRDVSRYNPVNWAVEVGRQTLTTTVDWQIVATRGGALLALALVCAWISVRAFRAYQRSI